jgi:1-acyl-sn-glycerol-3-phosphate acyltransferase
LSWSAGSEPTVVAGPRWVGERLRIRARIEHLLRRLGTGFLFATFGVGALVIAGIAFPFVAWRSEASEARERIAQRLIQRSFAFFVRLGTALHLFEVRKTGIDCLAHGPSLVVANHPTLLDAVFLISHMPQADCIVKSEVWRNPFLRHVVRIAGYIPNGEGPQVVDSCVERLRAGRSVVLFPEGSRSPEGGLRPFKRGAAHIALRSGCPITLVFLTCTPPALKKGQPWWAVPDRKLLITMDVESPVIARDFLPAGEANSTSRAVRSVTAALYESFDAKRLDAGA